ncbi:MAG: hypothetical protein Q9186_006800 [Xanthomendoza sp. 1 TL-2023]
MPFHNWRSIDQAHLLQKIILLQLLNRTPKEPTEINLSEWKTRGHNFHERIFDLQREKELTESFAFLAARTDDPKKVVAACVEEGEDHASLTVRLAMNKGNLDHVIAGFERMAEVFERFARTEHGSIEQEHHALLYEALKLNQNRILVRLRSRHATLKCNFKKGKMQQPRIIPQLYEAIHRQALAQSSGVTHLLFNELKADVEKLHGLFLRLENLETSRAKSSSGLELLVQIVIICQQVYDRRILHQVLIGSSRLDTRSRTSIVRKITKLSRYYSVSRFLLQAARKYPVFRRVRISAVCFKAPNLPATELDSITADFIHGLLDRPKLLKLVSKFPGASSSFAIENHIRQEATLSVPVHAEVQLLFHYESNTCNLPPRIICSSKQACFLCDLFFKIHGRFTVPSTHGRLYEKWALPDAVKTIGSAGGDMLKTLGTFVSAIENALLHETQSTRISYPDPYESMILHSAVFSQPNQSRTSAHSSSTIQRSPSNQDPISAPKTDTRSPRGSPVPCAGKTALATSTESKIDVPSSRSVASSSATAIICAPSPLHAPSEHVTSSEGSTNSDNLHVSLTKGQPIWREISSTSHSFQARTPHIRLTISQDEPFGDQSSRVTSHDVVAGRGHYWVTLEYVSDRTAAQSGDVPLVNVLEIPTQREMVLDYGTAEWPRALRVCSNDDVISITYSSTRPISGKEYTI